MTPQEAWVQFCLSLPREPMPCIRAIREVTGENFAVARDLYERGVRYVHGEHPIVEETPVNGEFVSAGRCVADAVNARCVAVARSPHRWRG